MTAVLLGCQGWEYSGWIGSFYPSETSPADMLREYGARLRTVELPDTIVGIPPEPTVESWRDSVPDGFIFSLKVPQQVTHETRLDMSHPLLGKFVDRVSLLGDKLGPLLLQLPPGFRRTAESESVLGSFVRDLPQGFRWAVEFRSAEWLTRDVQTLLAERGISLVLADARWVRRSVMLDLASCPTADFAYVRWGGSAPARAVAPSQGMCRLLSTWNVAVGRLLGAVETVFGYFGNNFGGDGPSRVQAFKALIDRQGSRPGIANTSCLR
ncbi:MAG: DUF72 domain-containing protein [Gemmatimonadales bacterium]